MVALRIATVAIKYQPAVETAASEKILVEWHGKYGRRFLEPQFAAAAETTREKFEVLAGDKGGFGKNIVTVLKDLAPETQDRMAPPPRSSTRS